MPKTCNGTKTGQDLGTDDNFMAPLATPDVVPEPLDFPALPTSAKVAAWMAASAHITTTTPYTYPINLNRMSGFSLYEARLAPLPEKYNGEPGTFASLAHGIG